MNKKPSDLADNFDKQLGLKTILKKEGHSRKKLKVKKWHLNYGGIVHGGVLATMCDCVLADAITSDLKKNQWCVTVQLNIDYLEPAFLGETLFGYSKLIRKGNTLAFVEGGIETENKKQIAKAYGIWFIKFGPSRITGVKKKIKRMD